MSDPRILKYYDAVLAMQNGQFNVSFPGESDDDVARLGGALRDLARVLELRFEEIETLGRITERANAGLVLEEVLNFLYESFQTAMPYDRIGLALLEAEGRLVRARWARSQSSDLAIEKGYSAPLKGSSLEEIIRTGRPRIINDLESYLKEHPQSDSTKRIVQEGMRSSLTCPLVAFGRSIGFLFFSSTETETYRDEHEQLFMRIAGQLSTIFEKSRLYERVLELNRGLLAVQNELEYQATHDVLTNLWNRGAILEALEKEIARSRRESRPLSVIMTDIDRFKQLNDSHGHQAGDVVLSEIASRLSSSLRTTEWLGRYGGEEFLIVVYPCDEDSALCLMERIRSSICSRSIETNGGRVQATISLGAAVGHNTRRIDAETFVRVADEALYQAKKSGRNRSSVRSIQID
jgi:diguanylate cyclase (GGDEF)-like protein